MKTTLRNVKERAYSVKLELEERVEFLLSSPHAVAFDLWSDRLLYHRGEWHYWVIKGTEEVYDHGFVRTQICQLPAAEMPLQNVAQGTVLAQVDEIVLAGDPGFEGPRTVEVIAVDQTNGSFCVYSHTFDAGDPIPPYETHLHAFSPAGGPVSSGAFAQPDDGTPPWWVPHAIVLGGSIFAIERDFEQWPDAGPATGHVIRRAFGSVGSTSLQWSPLDRYVYPHSLAYNEATNQLWVFVTKLFDPGTLGAYKRSYAIELNPDTLGFIVQHEIHFGFDQVEGIGPYFLGDWEAAGSSNNGGLCLFDGGSFVTSGITPNGYNPTSIPPVANPQTFRWSLLGPGLWLADLGADLPIPLHRTPTGALGAWHADLPEELGF